MKWLERTHQWNRLIWKKITLGGPLDKSCPKCGTLSTGSILFLNRFTKTGYVYLLPCFDHISPEQGMAIMASDLV